MTPAHPVCRRQPAVHRALLLAALLLAVLVPPTRAAADAPTWERIIATPRNDTAFFSHVSRDGRVLIAGQSAGRGWVEMLNPGGDTAWNRPGGTLNVQERPDGAMWLIAARGRGRFTATLLAQDGSALREESLRVPLAEPERVQNQYAVRTAEGGYVIAVGSSEGGWLIRLAPDGSERWRRAISTIAMGRLHSVQVHPTGGYVLFGPVGGDNAMAQRVLRLDEQGRTRWARTFSQRHKRPKTHDALSTVVPTPDGGVVIAGRRADVAWVARLAADGSTAWERSFRNMLDTVANTVHALPHGGFVLAGATRGSGLSTPFGWLAAVSAEGTLGWERVYSASGSSVALNVNSLPDGSLVIVGTILPFLQPQGGFDAWVMRLTPEGRMSRSR